MEVFLWVHHFDRSKNLKLSLSHLCSTNPYSSSPLSFLPPSYCFLNSAQLTSSLLLSKSLHSSKSLSAAVPRHASPQCRKLPTPSASLITFNPIEQVSLRLLPPIPRLLPLLSCLVSQLSITFDPPIPTNYTLLPRSLFRQSARPRFGDYSEGSNGLEKLERENNLDHLRQQHLVQKEEEEVLSQMTMTNRNRSSISPPCCKESQTFSLQTRQLEVSS